MSKGQFFKGIPQITLKSKYRNLNLPLERVKNLEDVNKKRSRKDQERIKAGRRLKNTL